MPVEDDRPIGKGAEERIVAAVIREMERMPADLLRPTREDAGPGCGRQDLRSKADPENRQAAAQRPLQESDLAIDVGKATGIADPHRAPHHHDPGEIVRRARHLASVEEPDGAERGAGLLHRSAEQAGSFGLGVLNDEDRPKHDSPAAKMSLEATL